MLSDSTQQLTPNLSLNTLSRFENATVGADIHAFTRPRQAFDVATLSAQDQFFHSFDVHPYPPRWLTDEFHLLNHRLAVPVFQS